MEELRNRRRPLIVQFDRLERELKALMETTPMDPIQVKAKFRIFSDNYLRIMEYDQKVMEQAIAEPLTLEEEDQEYGTQTDMSYRAEVLQQKVDQLKARESSEGCSSATVNTIPASATPTDIIQGAAKLPQIQMMQYDGDLLKFLPFWSQFKLIDQNQSLSGSYKFWYLLQCLKPGTDAYEIVSTYPQTDEMYPKAVDALHKRFGNKDVLLQVYIRELLKLVIANANTKDKIPLKNLHFKLKSHLNALKSLGLEKADTATWLFPLVESSLPEKVLYNWQRSASQTDQTNSESATRNRLDQLMNFMEREVEIDQRIEITKSFTTDKPTEDRKPRISHLEPVKRQEKRKIPTISGFHVGNVRKCVFCDRDNHDSKACFRAQKMKYDEKREILKKKGLCFRCMGRHMAKNCGGDQLNCDDCGGKHHTVVCPGVRSSAQNEGPVTKSQRLERGEDKASTNFSNVLCNDEIALQTVMVRIGNGTKTKLVRAFIDSGSQRSYILGSTARELELDWIGSEVVVHSLFGGQTTRRVTHSKMMLKMKSVVGEFQCTVEVRDQPRICCGLPRVNVNSELWTELKSKGVVLSDSGNGAPEIEVLIGADIYGILLTGKVEHLNSGAVAIETWLGWTLIGPVMACDPERSLGLIYVNMAINDSSISKLWDLELLGIRDPVEAQSAAQRELEAKQKFIESVTRTPEGRYVVQLPWKINHPELPSNREVALKRLESTARSLKTTGYFEKYGELFMEWRKEGFIEEVPQNTLLSGVHYIPHRAVIKTSSATTPVRPVFDASCRTGKNPSLNQCLETGSNCIQLIPDVLLRFRENRIGFVSDIRKAFQMIEVKASDRDFMRFFWYADSTWKEIIEYRHSRVMFGATCSPFILGAVLELHLTTLSEHQAEVGKKLLESFYVDNCVSSVNTLEEYRTFREESIRIMQNAKMDLRMWYSSVEEFDNPNEITIPVLGMKWDRQRDKIFISVPDFTVSESVTKREVLSSIHRIFDPLGFVAPALLPMKILLQEAWKEKRNWNEKLPGPHYEEFKRWCNGVKKLESVRASRMITGGVLDKDQWSLHIFTDASKKAYGAVAYLRTEMEGMVSVQFVCAKCRLAPIKPMTITRLELMGCLVGVRLGTAVKKALKLENVREVYHTDSAVALAWIRRNDQWGTFVGNRTKEINATIPSECWRHVPGHANPADLASRGCTPSQLLSSHWLTGPEWLFQVESEWPRSCEAPDEPEVECEIRKTTPKATSHSITCASLLVERIQNRQSYCKMIRIVGWIQRFLHNKFTKIPKDRRTGDLSMEELKRAEMALVRSVQRDFFQFIKKNEFDGLLTVKDEFGVHRVKTKLTNLPTEFDFKFPMILPGKALETRQLILDMHKEYCHAGIGFLMSKLRKRFASKGTITESAPLPLDRIKSAEVFEVVGVDLAGPMFLKNGQKIWLVIFTCAVFRAVHFELVSSLSTKAFVKSMRAFIRKYRRPEVIYSDNGTNFRGTDALFKSLDWNAIVKEKSVRAIQWNFIPPTSAWWGGWWERLIRSAKDLLRRTVGKNVLNRTELQDVIDEVANAMNERPLTYISENPEDLEPLTPALFLHPFGSVAFPEEEMTDGEKLRMRYQYVKTLQQQLKGRFRKEYLAQLVDHNKSKPSRTLKVGDLVFVGQDGKKRLDWKLGRIKELFSGTDGVARVAVVKTQGGDLKRPVQRLHLLECDDAPEESKALRQTPNVTIYGREIKKPKRF